MSGFRKSGHIWENICGGQPLWFYTKLWILSCELCMTLLISNISIQKCYSKRFTVNSYFPFKICKFSPVDVFPYMVCTVLSLIVDWAFTIGWHTFEGTKFCGFCRALKIYIIEIIKSPSLLYITRSSSNNISRNMLFKNKSLDFWWSICYKYINFCIPWCCCFWTLSPVTQWTLKTHLSHVIDVEHSTLLWSPS